MISAHFPKIIQKLSEGHTKNSKYFPPIFTKIAEDALGRPEEVSIKH